MAVFALMSAGTALLYDDGIDYVHKPIALKDDQIDVGLAALAFCKEIHPKVDIAAYSRKIDALVEEIRARVHGSLEPNERIVQMNKVIFDLEGYGYDDEGVKKGEKDVSLLTHLMDTKKGNCFALPTLYMAVGQRLGYPIFMTAVPGHAYIRYVDPDSDSVFNIEATAKGTIYRDDSYMENFSVNKRAMKLGSYGRAMSNREFLGELFGEASFFYRNGLEDQKKALSFLETAVALNPLSPENYAGLAAVHSSLSILCEGPEGKLHFSEAFENDKTATDLGYVPTDETAYAKSKRK